MRVSERLPQPVQRKPVEERIARLRARIRSERETTRASVLVVVPKLSRVARFLWRLKGVPQIATRLLPLLLPVAGMVFRNNPVLRTAMRVWGLARLAKTIANSVGAARRPVPVALAVPAQ